MKDVRPVIAQSLGIAVENLDDDLSYQAIPEWDSLGHVELMVALETHLNQPISEDLMLQLTSVRAICAFAETSSESVTTPEPPPALVASGPTVHRGLDGVYIDRSAITYINGTEGELEYRGYSIHDLVEQSSFEETAWLLIYGELPNQAQLSAFTEELRTHRELPAPVLDLMRALASCHPMEALRTGVSMLGALMTPSQEETPEAALAAGIRLIAQIPTLIAAHHALRNGREPIAPQPSLSHAENLLTMLFGETPSPEAVHFVDKDLIVHADHDLNASAFAARVAIGCRAPLSGAITAAIAAFAGSLHGGAAEKVMELIDAIGSPENADAYVQQRLEQKQRVMGFGHRVYRTEDPRARHLREAARQLSRMRGDMRGFDTIEAVIKAMEPYAKHGVGPNVDLYAGLAYRHLGLPDDLAVPMFVAGRIAGWVAQALEQKSNNVLIRPLLLYVGPKGRTFTRGA